MLVPSRAELPNRWATLRDIQAMTRSPPTHRDETLAHAAEIKSSIPAEQHRIGFSMNDKIARRDFLGSVALAGAAAAVGQNFMATPANAVGNTENPIISSSASELASAIR